MNNFLQRLLTGSLLATILCIIFFYFSPPMFSIFLLLSLIIILTTEIPSLIAPHQAYLWLVYPIAPFCLLMYLNHTNRPMLLFIFTSSAIFDSGAYFCGKLLGTKKLAPTISPGKTWQGVIGGWLILATGMLLAQGWYKTSYHPLIIIGMSIIISSAATTGDLFESWLKRRAHKKDAGQLLPGHGGLLDRFDSILFVGVIIFLIAQLRQFV